MIIPWHSRAALADQKIEVDTLICLQNMVNIKLDVTAPGVGRWWTPRGPAPRQFGIVDSQMQAARSDIQRDQIAVLYQPEWTAGSRLGRDMQNHRPISGSRHSGVRNSDHIGNSLLEYLGW